MNNQKPPRISKENAQRLKFRPFMLISLVVTGVLWISGLMNSKFLITDDSQTYWTPFIRWLGAQSNPFSLPTVLPGGGMGGNYIAEAQLGQNNPIIFLLAKLLHNVSSNLVFSLGLKSTALTIFIYSVYRLYLTINFTNYLALVLALGVGFSGFILYVEIPSWTQATFANGFMLLSIASILNKQTSLKSRYITSSVFCSLGILMGYTYGTLVFLPIVLYLIILTVFENGFKDPVSYLCIVLPCAMAIATYVPGLMASSVSWKSGWKPANSGFMTMNVGDLFGAGYLSMHSQVNSWGGLITQSPWGYVFLGVPVLASAFSMRNFFKAGLNSKVIVVICCLSALIFIAPSDLGPFHWPVRLSPIFYVFLIGVLGIGIDTSKLKSKLFHSTLGGLITLGFLRAMALTPGLYKSHLISLGIILIFSIVFLKFLSNQKSLLFGSFSVFILISGILIQHSPAISSQPLDIAQYNSPTSDQGYNLQGLALHTETFQIADIGTFGDNLDPKWKYFFFGHQALPLGVDLFNSGTALGHKNYSQTVCIGFNGSTCPSTSENLMRKDAHYGLIVLDAMGINQIISTKNEQLSLMAKIGESGWRLDSSNEYRDVWHRKVPLSFPIASQISPNLNVRQEKSIEKVNGYRLEGDISSGVVIPISFLNFPGLKIVDLSGNKSTLISNGPFNSFYALKLNPGHIKIDIVWQPRFYSEAKLIYEIAMSFYVLMIILLFYFRTRRTSAKS